MVTLVGKLLNGINNVPIQAVFVNNNLLFVQLSNEVQG